MIRLGDLNLLSPPTSRTGVGVDKAEIELHVCVCA